MIICPYGMGHPLQWEWDENNAIVGAGSKPAHSNEKPANHGQQFRAGLEPAPTEWDKNCHTKQFNLP